MASNHNVAAFNSEGFDLDALSGNGAGVEQDVVYEIGGGATTTTTDAIAAEKSQNDDNDNKETQPQTPLQLAEDWKQRGNTEFKQGNYLEAYDLYTEAIDACPCPIKGKDILQQRDEFNAAEREKARQRMEEETKRGRQQQQQQPNKDEGKETKSESSSSKKEEENNKKNEMEVFVLPPKEHGDTLAVYYCNRAATSTALEHYQQAIEDCDIAVLLNPKYTKAYTRRSAAYEKTERTEEALRDAKLALQLEPSNPTIRKSVSRLQKIEDERLEKLKVGRRCWMMTGTMRRLQRMGFLMHCVFLDCRRRPFPNSKS